MRAHSVEQLLKLRDAINTEIDSVIKSAKDMEAVTDGKSFAANGTNLVRTLASCAVMSEVMATYVDEWAQALAEDVLLESDGFDAVLSAMSENNGPN